MIPNTIRFYNPVGTDHVAVVSVGSPMGKQHTYPIHLARAATSSKLGTGVVHGPYTEDQLAARFAEIVDALKVEGFLPSGLHALLAALDSPNAAIRGRAAARIGWRRSPEALDRLLAILPQAVDDGCPIIDALGTIGDPRAIPSIRPQATRKLLSRRRSGVEALRNLGDTAGLAEARQAALERLTPSFREKVESLGNEGTNSAIQELVEAVLALELSHQGLALDTLYELATPATLAAVRKILVQIRFDQPHIWRYIKSVFKRALLRHDDATFGLLSHAIERQGRSGKGTTATVKSGYDGVQRKTSIFRRKTQDYMRRLAWRYLRMLAAHRPETYAHAAAEALIHYGPEDAKEPQGLQGQYAACYLLHRILWGSSKRFTFDGRRMVFRFRNSKSTKAPAGVREEAYSDLWDAQPRAYLRVLGAAQLAEAHQFALRAIQTTHRAVLEAAQVEEVTALLQAPYEPTVQLGLAELERRFDPHHPDWSLLRMLVADERPLARELGHQWVRLTAPLWTRNPEQIIAFLASPNAETRSLVVELTLSSLGTDLAFRQTLAQGILNMLRTAEPTPGAHEGFARVAREGLAEEIGALLTLPQLLALLSTGSPSAQSVAGELLGRRPEALRELGLERLTLLAQHKIAAVRSGAQRLLRSAVSLLQADPSLLFVLVESEWEDTRGVAFDLLREQIDLTALGVDGLMGLVDSNRVDVQDLGKELVLKHFADLPIKDLVFRLVQHPHPNMRRFSIDLVMDHLPPGAEALEKLEQFFRAGLFDLWPERPVKRKVVDFLTTRGLQDEQQAAIAARILGAVVRFQGRADFERALEGLVRLKLAYPEVAVPVTLRAGGEA